MKETDLSSSISLCLEGIDVSVACPCHGRVRLIIYALRLCQFNQSIIGHFVGPLIAGGRDAGEFCGQSVVYCTQIHFCRIGTAADIDGR